MIASRAEIVSPALARDPQRVRKAVGWIRQDERINRQAGWNDRRSSRRIRVQKAVYVTPVWLQARLLRVPEDTQHSFIASTTDLSPHGIGLLHDEPLLSRYALVTFELRPNNLVSLLMQLGWSRRRVDRHYTSGGNIITATETPSLVREFAAQRPLPTSCATASSHEMPRQHLESPAVRASNGTQARCASEGGTASAHPPSLARRACVPNTKGELPETPIRK
ncbi:MAG: hypothetical protein HY000_06050 [Planctomycetes bacterium]|nr:hypothetical protein [Planctomycetota bacterium]